MWESDTTWLRRSLNLSVVNQFGSPDFAKF